MADITNQQLLEALTGQLGIITDQMVTKDELKQELERFATKEDLERFATKEDLECLAAKNDLEHSTINNNLARLERKLDSGRATNVKHHLETRKMIGDLSRQHW